MFLKHIRARYQELGFKKFLLYFSVVYWLVLFLHKKRDLKYIIKRFFAKKHEGGSDRIIKEINGSKMYLDLNDQGLSKDLFLDGRRELFSTRLVKKIVQPGDIVVDIGGNLGYYTLLMSRLVGPSGKVFAVEPVSTSFRLLEDSIALNKYNNIYLKQYAIGSENKPSTIYVSNKRNSSSLNKKIGQIAGVLKEQPIEMITLDKLMAGKPYPALLRMDVEGYETEIIKGASSILGENKPLKILMELHSAYIGREGVEYIVNRLKNFGFSIGQISLERSLLIINSPRLIQRLYNILLKPFGGMDQEFFNSTQDEKAEFLKTPSFFQVLFERK